MNRLGHASRLWRSTQWTRKEPLPEEMCAVMPRVSRWMSMEPCIVTVHGDGRERATGDRSFHVRGSLGSGGGGEELAERVKAQVRARVEHPFRVVKRQFGYVKVRYRGLAKNRAQLVTLFALSNLWMVRHTVRVG